MAETELQRAGYHAEPPELLGRNLAAGVRLWVAAQVFFFGAFLFAFFYLRELNNSGMWHPQRVKAPTGVGAAILACVLAGVAVYGLAMIALRRRGEASWRPAAALALALTLAALSVQCYEWASLGFGPTDGSFASVFLGWTGFYAAFGLFAGILWLESVLAASVRHRGKPPGPVVAPAEAPGGGSGAVGVMRAEAQAFAVYAYFLAIVEVVTFVLLYVVH